MLYSEIMAVCSQIHTKHINTLCGQNVEFSDVKAGGTYKYHCGLKRYTKVRDFTCTTDSAKCTYTPTKQLAGCPALNDAVRCWVRISVYQIFR
jgi:hypothetical protein